MAENSEMITSSQNQKLHTNDSEHVSKRRVVSKNRISRVLSRHPIQRHCLNRKLKIKRKKRRLPLIQEPLMPELQDLGSPNAAGSSFSFSQSSTSSSSSPQSPPILLDTTTKKRKYAVDKCDGRGETALHKAAIKGDVQKVKLLLRRGANPNHQDYAGWTPLHEACIRGWYHVAQALLKAGANANTPGLHNVTALHDATAWSHLSLVKLLLKYGAKLTSKTDKGDTPIELASAPVLHYLQNHGLVPDKGARVVQERTYEMRKSTYRSKVVKANSADVTFKIKVRCDQKGEERGTLKHGKKSKKKKTTRLSHWKKKMETDESKKDTNLSVAIETKEATETNASKEEEMEAASSAASVEPAAESESRRSSVSLDDEDEGKRNKKRKEREEHQRKEETRTKEEHKKEDAKTKKDEPNSKNDDQQCKKEKEEHSITKGKASSTNSASPKSTTSADGQDIDDSKSVGSPGPKVPPLKIVIPQGEAEQGSRNGKSNNRHHPYVVVSNDETSTAVSTVTTSPSSPSVAAIVVKDEPASPSSNPAPAVEDSKIQPRVLRSTHSNRASATNNSGGNGSSSSNASSAASGNSSPTAPDLFPQTEPNAAKEETKCIKTESAASAKSVKSVETPSKSKADASSMKIKAEPEDEAVAKSSNNENRTSTMPHHKEENNTVVDLHPRKRKLKTKQETTHTEAEHVTSFSSAPHPHEVPVTNCYQMFMDIRRQIDIKRKGLFPIQPKPPQGFKEYLMNRCTYTLAGNSTPRLKRRNTEPPEGVPEGMKELYLEQEAERYSLRMQHIVEKEKLVLSVEQEILRVHGRAARALANQALPFSACTILKDEEVYNVITPEQEEKDRNARSRYNGRLFISWLQDVDDKWEKIKEEMLARHHKEAESLNAIQKFRWDLRMRQLGLSKKMKFVSVDDNYVPMISVSDDFDLLPE